MCSFPDFTLTPSLSSSSYANILFIGKYWASYDNKLRFLTTVAKDHGFDPLIAESWYKYSSTEIINMLWKYKVFCFFSSPPPLFLSSSSLSNFAKGGHTVLRRHKAPAKLVMDIFPHIDLDPSKFKSRYSMYPSY